MELEVKKLRDDYKEPHHLFNTSDNRILFIREWVPESHSDVAILIFHGITAYSGLYSEMVATPLKDAGFIVYGLDLRGHGLSDGKRGDFPSLERLNKDLHEVISFIKQKHSKLIILGHSMGVITAGIASNCCLESIDGLILLSAGRTPREGVYQKPKLSYKIKILLSSIFAPGKPVFRYYREGMIGLDDPIRNFKYTLRFMKVFSAKDMVFPSINIPVIVGVGDLDELFDIESPRDLFNEINAQDKKFIILKGAKHAEMPAGSLDELVEWLALKFKQ